jgi:hypothetical protein
MKHKAESMGTITSVDGKTTITLEEFDRRAENGESLDEFFDYSQARRAGKTALKKGDLVTVRELRGERVVREYTYRHGGRRAGAGRKPTGHVRVQLLISAAARDRLDELARRRGTTRSQVVEELAVASEK